MVELENGFRFYHAGDTDVFGDMRLIRELYRPDLALLPIGGHFTMGPREAALAVELLGVKHVMPIHYGTFPILAGTPDELRAELAARGLGDVEVHAPEPGGIVRASPPEYPAGPFAWPGTVSREVWGGAQYGGHRAPHSVGRLPAAA